MALLHSPKQRDIIKVNQIYTASFLLLIRVKNKFFNKEEVYDVRVRANV